MAQRKKANTNIVDKTMPDDSWSFRLIGRAAAKSYTHGYHRYPAKFIPQIVSKLLEEYSQPQDFVCDPFGGCGTTLVESKLRSRRCVGFDVNPIAKLITSTKICAIKPIVLDKNIRMFNRYMEKPKTYPMHYNKRLYYWFDENTLRKLNNIYWAINQLNGSDIKRFFYCAFSHNLKNSSKWLMKSIKPTVDKSKNIEEPFTSYKRQLNYMRKKNTEYYVQLLHSNNLKIYSKMFLKDSTKRLPLTNATIDLIITSPPYVTSYEYADLHQLSLLWFSGDYRNFPNWKQFVEDPKGFKNKFVGSMSKNTNYNHDYRSGVANSIVTDLSIADKQLAKNVSNYYMDMSKAFKEMYRVIKPGGKICTIIGNTRLKGISILNAQVAFEQLQDIGFSFLKVIKRQIPTKLIAPWRDKTTGKFTGINSQNKIRAYEYEYIIVMEKA